MGKFSFPSDKLMVLKVISAIALVLLALFMFEASYSSKTPRSDFQENSFLQNCEQRTDVDICSLIRKVNASLQSGEYQYILSLLEPESLGCQSGPAGPTYGLDCRGKAAGTKIDVVSTGHFQSDCSHTLLVDFENVLKSYLTERKTKFQTYTRDGSVFKIYYLVSGDDLNSGLAFEFSKEGSEWKIANTMLGRLSDSQSYGGGLSCRSRVPSSDSDKLGAKWELAVENKEFRRYRYRGEFEFTFLVPSYLNYLPNLEGAFVFTDQYIQNWPTDGPTSSISIAVSPCGESCQADTSAWVESLNLLFDPTTLRSGTRMLDGFEFTEYSGSVDDNVLGGARKIRYLSLEHSGSRIVLSLDGEELTPDFEKVLESFRLTSGSSSSIPVEWQTYMDKDLGYSFRYPSNWYFEKDPQDEKSVSFFRVGDVADHGYGDHVGNEVFSVLRSADSRTLSQIKAQDYPQATDTKVGDKAALETAFGLTIVNIRPGENLEIVTGRVPSGVRYATILSSFEFDE